MKTYLIASLFFLTCLASKGRAASQDLDELLQWMPERTCHLVVVNHFSQAWETASDRDGAENSPRTTNDQESNMETVAKVFQDRFGLAPALLAEIDPMALVHAEVAGAEGASHGLLVARFDDQNRVSETLAKARSILEQTGGFVKSVQFGEIAGTQYTWNSTSQTSRTIIHVVAHNYLICGTDLSLVTSMVPRAANSAKGTDTGLPGAASIISNLARAQAEDQPSLFWYSNPGCILGSLTNTKPDAWFERHGLNGIQALGGNINLSPDGSLLAQTVIIAPPPRKGSLGILQLTPAEDWQMPAWLCSDFDELIALHGDVSKAFEFLGTIFDEVYADGIEGTYDAILEDLRDEGGLNIDLKTQLYRYLGPRVLLVRHPPQGDAPPAKGPITYAIETSRSEAVASAVRTLFADDPEVKSVSIPDCKEPLWLIAGGGTVPDSGVLVARGFLIYAENVALLRQTLATEKPAKPELAAGIRDLSASLPSTYRHTPSMLWARDRIQRPAVSTKSVVSADFIRLFLTVSPEWADVRNLIGAEFAESVSVFAPLLQHFSTGFGFIEEDGWSLFMK